MLSARCVGPEYFWRVCGSFAGREEVRDVFLKMRRDLDPRGCTSQLAHAPCELLRSRQRLSERERRVSGLGWHEEDQCMDFASWPANHRQIMVTGVGKIGDNDCKSASGLSALGEASE